MASCRVCSFRKLVAIVCGLLTAIILGLGIWRAVIRIQTATLTTQSSNPQAFCRNGGTWENGRCICPEDWKGLRCTIINFCEKGTYKNFTFPKVTVGKYGSSLQTCENDTLNAGSPKAVGLCNHNMFEQTEFQNVSQRNCNENLQTLEQQIDNDTKPEEYTNISSEVQILTADASKLTAGDIASATRVVRQIFDVSQDGTSQAKKIAVTTVGQLLDANEEVFQTAAADNETFSKLIKSMENYSLSLDDGQVVVPNIAVQSVDLSQNHGEGGQSIRFSVMKGANNSLLPGLINVNSSVRELNPDEQTELQILLNVSKADTKCGFIVFQNSKLFQSKSFTTESNFSQRIISGTTEKNTIRQSASVEMVFNPKHHPGQFELHSYACVFWDFSMNDWSTDGCSKNESTAEFLYCRCNHTSNFAVLMSFKRKYRYPKSLDVLSTVGCALSIAGLVLTIIFQVVTRKVRKTSVTWVLVNLCTSMLIFNLLFVFGIENSNKYLTMNNSSPGNVRPTKDIVDIPNLTCTVMAALLHYFLLVTFTWTGLSSAQLYFLLIRTMKPLPPHFILFVSLIGWGVPAIVVALTVGIIYSQDQSNPAWELGYRQEEICWLANKEFIKSPLLWSLFIPVAIILISNVVVFVIITVKVLWKNNQNLTSTKKVSSMKKVLSTLSVAVIFGITWILAFFMLIGNDGIRLVLSYIFCLLNTTQGLQIFILYTVRTDIFQSEASKVLKSLSSSAGSVKAMPFMTLPNVRIRMYNMLRSFPTLTEHFRLLEPSVITEEMTLSESDQANSSM
ncbi:adhesion G-protein coupled receptor G7 [Tamandua tetradactyla]|uniref:adhesion G-protein coupled receptor G7 n=1 Tax=Tamandua tetradactyla TaxID=48850 RepID=UPI0040538C13